MAAVARRRKTKSATVPPVLIQPSRLLRAAGLVEGVLLLVASECVQAAQARGLRSLLTHSGTELLGVLVNKQRNYVPHWLRPQG